MRQLSVTQQLVLVAFGSLLPVFALLLYNLLALQNARERELHELARGAAEVASLEMAGIVASTEGVLSALSRAPVIRTFDVSGCNRYLADIGRHLPQFTAIAAIDDSRVLRCRSEAPQRAVRLSDRPYVDEVLSSGGFVVGNLTRSAVSGAPNLPAAVPIVNEADEILGVLAAGLDLNWLAEQVTGHGPHYGASLIVTDQNGNVIAADTEGTVAPGDRLRPDLLELMSSAQPGVIETASADGRPYVLGFVPAAASPSQLNVLVQIARDEAMDPVNTALVRGATLALLFSLLALIAAWVFGRKLFRDPLRSLLSTVRQWKSGDESVRTGLRSNGSEIHALGACIDEFLDELVAARKERRQAEEHQRLLTRELDHRVKNMLATVRAIAHQTLKREASEESLGKFSDRLGALANAHDVLLSDNASRRGLLAVVETALRPFDGSGRFQVEGPPLRLSSKAALAISMALHELCTNAVKYGALSAETGTVEIGWRLEGQEEHQRFVFLWSESGGPVVKRPKRTGFGSKMIQRILSTELEAEVSLEFPSEGAKCKIGAPAAAVLEEEPYQKTLPP